MAKLQNSHMLIALVTLVCVVAVVGMIGISKSASSPWSAGASNDRNAAGFAMTARGNDAQCVVVNAPQSVAPGQQFTAAVVMRNVGTTTWPAMEWYNLGSQLPADNGIWGMGRVRTAYAVAPGSYGNYTATFTAPASTGAYPFAWRMVQDGAEWFGDVCMTNISVVRANDAQCEFISAPSTVQRGQPFSAVIAMRNTGSATWPAYQWHNLGSQSPPDNSNWGTGRVRLAYPVAPGQVAYFNSTFVPPNTTTGPQPFDWRMVQDGLEWFGATCRYNVTVV